MTTYTTKHSLPLIEPAKDMIRSESGDNLWKQLNALAGAVDAALVKADAATVALLEQWKAGLPFRGRMLNGTNVDTLTIPGTYVIPNQAAADSMLNLAVATPSLFFVEGDPSVSTVVFSQTQKAYGATNKTYDRIARGAGPIWNPWKDTSPTPVAPSPGGTASDTALANKALLDAFILGRGGPIGTGGLAAVSIRVDHGAINLRDKVLPKARARSIPLSLAINPAESRLNLPESAGVTWANYNSWAMNDAVEPWNHSMTHANAETTAALTEQLVNSRTLLQEKMPNSAIEGFAIPGVSGGTMNGWTDANTPQHFYEYEAGRLVLANHAVCTGYILGKLRPLTGVPMNGQTHYSIDNVTDAQTAINVVKEAQATGSGLQIMLHPSQVDEAGKISSSVLHAIMDYLADERDAGRLLLLSMSGLLLADVRHSYRHNLLANGNFNGLTGWAAAGGWTTNGEFARSTDSAAGMLTQTVSMMDRKAAAGRVRELRAEFRSAAGAVVRVTATHAGTGLSVSRDVTIPAGDTFRPVSQYLTVPMTAASMAVSVGRVSGGAVDVRKVGLLAA